MTLDKRPCALIFASFLCFAAALGGSAGAAEVYPGCAQPGPTGKVWYLDPVNGKTPADGGNGSQTAPWNSLPGVLSFKFPPGYTRPLLSSVPYIHVVDGKRVLRCGPAREPARPARRHDQADERQLRRHRHRRLLAADRQPEFRYSRGRAGPDAGVLDPVHPLDQQVGLQRHQSAEPVRHEQQQTRAGDRHGPGSLAPNLRHHPGEHADQHG